MAFWRRRGFGETRRSLRAIERLAAAVEAQTALLTRLADQIAPLPLPPQDLRDTGPQPFDDRDYARLVELNTRMVTALGRSPTDEELVEELALEQAETLRNAAGGLR